MIKIYIITNLLNNKKYIGQTRRKLSARFRDHCRGRHCGMSAISLAIKKYGEINFEINDLDFCETQIDADKKEQYWIDFYNTISPNGYNLRGGGYHGNMSESSKQKLRDIPHTWGYKLRGRIRTPEHCKKISEANRGKKATESQLRGLEIGRHRTKRDEISGERNGRAILKVEQVEEIRKLLNDGNLSQEKIGKMFGIKQVTVSVIKRNITWKNFP